ncbi:MAG: alpha-glucosidase [Oscillospiraceae bacterium]|nr:alpha-glucosidase [Oscillospiraceae bacterium]
MDVTTFHNEWWKEKIVYQIYPRSFCDSDNDGIGDIAGIISRLPYLKDLGVGVIWLSPVYASPDADNGYDISDYYDINPKLGSMDDMTKLIEQAKKLDIGIMMDLVINHTSDEHEWFTKSRNKIDDYRNYYIWRKGRGKGKAPNNWTSFFMDEVWEYDHASDEYYLHLFHKKQPDLNYENEKVIAEVEKIMRFWLDKGIVGFRCDVINVLVKETFEDGKGFPIKGLEHYKSKEQNHQILRDLRQNVLSHYDCFTVGEAVMVNLEEARLLSEPDRKELDILFYFDHLEVDRYVSRYIPKRFNALKLLKVLTKWQQGLSWNAVYFENHDQPRIVSHYGQDKEYWERSAKLIATMQLTLRGTQFIYQGQEIGMTNFDFSSIDELRDIESFNIDRLMKKLFIPKPLRWKWIKLSSRDNARTPMQWDDSEYGGFSTIKPWIGVNANHKQINQASQVDDPESLLSYYRQLIQLRKDSDTLKYGEFVSVYANSHLMVFARVLESEIYLTLLNFSSKQRKIPLPLSGEVVISNLLRDEYCSTLEAYEAIVIKNDLNAEVEYDYI